MTLFIHIVRFDTKVLFCSIKIFNSRISIDSAIMLCFIVVLINFSAKILHYEFMCEKKGLNNIKKPCLYIYLSEFNVF